MPPQSIQDCRNFIAHVLILLVFLIVPFLGTRSQVLSKSGATHHPTKIVSSDGLSVGYSFKVLEDAEGYLWIGTMHGLNRYDGYATRQYFADAHNDCSLKSPEVHDLFLDSNHRLWVANETGGLLWYDPKQDCFHQVKGMEQCDRAITQLPAQMHVGGEGDAASQGIHLLATNWKSVDSRIVSIYSSHAPSLEGERPDSILVRTLPEAFPWLSGAEDILKTVGQWVIAPDQSIWISNREGYYRLAASRKKPGTLNQSYFHFGVDASLSSKEDYDASRLRVLLDSKGNVYSLEIDGIYKYDKAQDKLALHIALPVGFELDSRAWLDRQDRLWSKWECSSYLRIDVATGVYDLIHTKGTVPAPALCGQGGGYEDGTGNYWFETNGFGVIKINGRQERFNLIQDNSIQRPYPTRQRHISPGKKAVYSPAVHQKVQTFKPHLASILKAQGFPLVNSETMMVVDSNGIYYRLASKSAEDLDRQILGFNLNTHQLDIKYDVETGDTLGPAYLMIIDKFGDFWCQTAGRFGLANYQKGYLIHFSPGSQKTEVFNIPLSPGNEGAELILDWYETPANEFWFATQQGLMHFSMSSHQWTTFSHVPGDMQSLSENYSLCVTPDPSDPERKLWVGSKGGGMNEFDIRTGKFRAYHRADGLPDETVYAILPDKFNQLWLSTNNGICRFDRATHACENFGVEEGLPGLEFNRMEFAESEDGTLMFGGVMGVVAFKPEDFLSRSAPSRLVFNSLKLGNRTIEFHPAMANDEAPQDALPFHLPMPMEFIHKLELNYDQNDFTIGFALLDYTSPLNNTFKYRLVGYSDEWIDAGKNHEAPFTNLSPGTYTLEVMGRNSRKTWTPEPIRLELVIHPPWWATWWFRTMAVLALMGVLYALYRFRLRQILKVERVRNRIAQDLHDEIGSTLSSIGLYSEVMQRSSADLPPQTQGILEKITISTSEMIETMNDIVWTIKSTNDTFSEVVIRMRAFAGNFSEGGKFRLVFEVASESEALKFSMEQRKNIYLIFKEAVNNAAKYSDCNVLRVKINIVGKMLRIEVNDDGKGFDPATLTDESNLGGNGLEGMKNRAEEIKARLVLVSSQDKGTTVTLEVPL
jgi:signal transduction histidine kinase/ligand-binding sensor domain-containing protein